MTRRVAAKAGRCGVKHEIRKLDSAVKSIVIGIVEEDETLNQYQIAYHASRRTRMQISQCDVSRVLKEVGYSRVRMTRAAAERSGLARALYAIKINATYRMDQFVFVDETAAVRHSDSPQANVSLV
jgi:arginine repressor